MTKTCRQCSLQFEITDDDLIFYEKVSPVFNGKKCPIPSPTICPDCRQKRRLCWRNERCLYEDKSDYSRKNVISVYSPEKTFKVFQNEEWWQDSFDPFSFGHTYNWSKSFFEQFKSLLQSVPRAALFNTNTENSLYTNYASDIKNCYLSTVCYYGCEDTHFSYWIMFTKDTMDCFTGDHLALCYECVNSQRCHHSFFCFRCNDCRDCYFSAQMRNCRNCLFCTNLSNQEYCIENKQYSKEVYTKIVTDLFDGSYQKLQLAKEKYKQIRSQMIVKNLNQRNCENTLGDDVMNCHNVTHCYSSFDLEDSKYSFGMEKGHHLHDAMGGFFEWCYEVTHLVHTNNCLFSSSIFNGYNMLYCENCGGVRGLSSKDY